MPFFQLVTTTSNEELQFWDDDELDSLVAWLREPFFFLREAPCDEDFDEASDDESDP